MKNKFNFRILNLLLLILFLYSLTLIKSEVFGILNTIINVIFPFVIAFTIAYAFHPLLRWLQKRKIPKWLGIVIIMLLIFGLLYLLLSSLLPLIFSQTIELLNTISEFIIKISTEYEINLGVIQKSLTSIIENFTNEMGKYITDGAVNILSSSINFIAVFIVSLISSIYMLSYMDAIRERTKDFFERKKVKTYYYIKTLDHEIRKYFEGLSKTIVIQFVEYTFALWLVGHPDFLFLGFLISFSSVIPYFGGIITTGIAVITAFVINQNLFIWTVIIAIVCPQIDAYITAPRVYGKTNRLPAFLTIFACYAGGTIGGFWGILLSLPITIIILTTYKFYNKDIKLKVSHMKEKNK